MRLKQGFSGILRACCAEVAYRGRCALLPRYRSCGNLFRLTDRGEYSDWSKSGLLSRSRTSGPWRRPWKSGLNLKTKIFMVVP